MKNINCPKCGKEMINLSHTNTGEFGCCGIDIEILPFHHYDGPEVVISNDKLKVRVVSFDEGINSGEVKSFRFDLYESDDNGEWSEIEDSFWTYFSTEVTIDELVSHAYLFIDEFSKMNLNPTEVKTFDFKNEKLYFGYSSYTFGEGIAISAFTDENEPWCTMTVNLPDKPPLGENEVYIPLYKVKDEYERVFKPNFVETELGFVKIGYGEGIHVKLVDDYKDKMVDMSC